MKINFKLLSLFLIIIIGHLNAVQKKEEVLAKFDGGKITREVLNQRINQIPVQYRANVQTTEGQTEFLNRLALEEIFTLDAIKNGYDKNEKVLHMLEQQLKPQCIEAYEKKNIVYKITDRDRKNYYDNNKKEFITDPRADIFHIQAENDSTATEILKEIKNGVDLVDIMNKYSVNKTTRELSGVVRSIVNRGFVRGVGKDEKLNNLIFSEEVNKVHGPITTETGIHFFKVTKRTEKRQKKYSEVKDQIDKKLTPIMYKAEHEKMSKKLYKDNGIKVNNELIASIDFNDDKTYKNKFDEKIISATNKKFEKTVKDYVNNYHKLPGQAKARYQTPEISIKTTEFELLRDLVYDAAVKTGIKDEILKTPQAEKGKKNTMLRIYVSNLMKDKTGVTDEDTKKYYNENIDKFKTVPYRSIQQFSFFTPEKADEAYELAHEAVYKPGFLFFGGGKRDVKEREELLKKVIALQEQKDEKNGIIEQVYQNGIIPGYGVEKEFNKAVWDLEIGKLSKIVTPKNNKKVFFIVTGETKAQPKAFEMVSANIKRMLAREKGNKAFKQLCDDISKKYNLVQYTEKLKIQLSAEELFNLAQTSQKQQNIGGAVKYYDMIIKEFPDGKNDYKAMFMKAFLYSEQKATKQKAIKTFETILTKFEEGELHESAKYMIKTLKEGSESIDFND